MQESRHKINIELHSDTDSLVHLVPNQLQDALLLSQAKELVRSARGEFHNKGIWRVKREHIIRLISDFKKLSPQMVIESIPAELFKSTIPIGSEIKVYENNGTQKRISYTPEDREIKELPQELTKKMYAYQRDCYNFAIKNSGRVMIADEMGVGKTLEALAIAWRYQQRWPLVIVCPGCLKLNWKDQIIKWLVPVSNGTLTLSDIVVVQKINTALATKPKILIVSYDTAIKFMSVINGLNSEFVICDEAHMLKNSNTKRATTLCPFICQRKHVLLITGTPALSRPKELYNLLRLVRPDIFKSFFTFANRYCDPRKSTFHQGYDYNGSSNIRELHYLMTSTIMIRRLKKDILTDLPQKIRQKIMLQTSPSIVDEIEFKIRKVSLAAINKFIQGIGNRNNNSQGNNDTSQNIWPIFTECYKLSGLAKLQAVKQYIQTLLEADLKFVVFAHHHEVLNGIEGYLRKYSGIQYIRIDGSTEQSKRHKLIAQFQESSSHKVALLSLTAAGQGFNITSASHAVFAELHWTPSTLNQAEDRLHRIGQTHNCVNCHYLIGQKTLDQKMWTQIVEKSILLSSLVDGEQSKYYQEPNFKKMKQLMITNSKPPFLAETSSLQSSAAAATLNNSESLFDLTLYEKQEEENPNTMTNEEVLQENPHLRELNQILNQPIGGKEPQGNQQGQFKNYKETLQKEVLQLQEEDQEEEKESVETEHQKASAHPENRQTNVISNNTCQVPLIEEETCTNNLGIAYDLSFLDSMHTSQGPLDADSVVDRIKFIQLKMKKDKKLKEKIIDLQELERAQEEDESQPLLEEKIMGWCRNKRKEKPRKRISKQSDEEGLRKSKSRKRPEKSQWLVDDQEEVVQQSFFAEFKRKRKDQVKSLRKQKKREGSRRLGLQVVLIPNVSMMKVI